MTPSRVRPEILRRAAKISDDLRYRYSLSRTWEPESDYAHPEQAVRFVMLNPSKADDRIDDPTIVRCIGFAQAWGYGGIVVHNLYALRSPKPAMLREVDDPVGPENDLYLSGVKADDRALPIGLTICGWGTKGGIVDRQRPRQVHALLERPHCLVLLDSGAPKHPLYIRGDTLPQPLLTLPDER